MKTRTALIMISIMNIVGGIIFNLRGFMNDYWPVTFKNVIVTLIYVAVWIIIFRTAIKNEYFGVIKVYSVFWRITCILALVTIMIKVTGINADGATLFIIPFLSQWYGIRYFIENSGVVSGMITIISLFILASTYLLSKRKRNKQV